MRSRLVIGLAALALALLLGLIGTARYALSEHARASDLQTRADALVQEKEALEGRLRGAQAEVERQRKLRKPTEDALNANPEWRDAPVPGAVSDGLCQRIRCAEARPLPTP